jgi:quinoprotein glucose dehydrogenase
MTGRMKSWTAFGLGVTALSGLILAEAPPQRSAETPSSTAWSYGGSVAQTRYSTLRQIDRTNVKDLEVAWTYDTGETGGLQTQPIVADGVLYAVTPSSKPFALRADTGERLWTFDSGLQVRGPNRGLMYWAMGDDHRVFAGIDRYVYALDARTGQPVPTFGVQGRIDLHQGLDRDPSLQSVRLTTPGVIYKDLLIVGGRVGEGLPASPGYVRAFDVRSGTLRWTFHTIPHPGERGYETWSKDSWTYNGGANSWPGMALDEARGIVYVPTGSAAADFYGANRIGDNLYANSLIALKADTGERLWHFQFVRHDIWDRDPPSPPVLVTLTRNGRRIDAVAQTTKHAYVFVFDRTTGKPVFPIEYRRFPKSDVPGEVTADTQPIPTRPRPFSRQELTREMLTTRTPEAHAWALREFASFRNGGQFLPFAIGKQTVVFPGFDGGAEWGGQAFDPETARLYVNANDIVWTGGLAPNDPSPNGRALYQQQCASCHRDDRAGTPPEIPSLLNVAARRSRAEIVQVVQKGGGRMPGFPSLTPDALNAVVEYVITGESPDADEAAVPPDSPAFLKYRFTGYRKFLDPEGYPAVAPPWGTLNAIDLNTGDIAWTVPLGEYPELAAKGLTNTGTENYGGPVVTAGGLVFIGATNYDRKFHAFDKATGTLLWETTLPFSGNATPATYEIGGRQFVVIAAGGGKSKTSGGTYVAFALPRGR